MNATRDALARGDTASALQSADKAIEAAPTDLRGYLARATVHDARREFEKAIADYSKVIELAPTVGAAYQSRGEDRFRLGQFAESVADFDRVIALNPEQAPFHWQRGISLYYAGEFERGAKQFEFHRTVNPEDVENAVWHFLCVARTAGVAKAREGLIPIHDDGRVPMMQVHAMFAGQLTPEQVLAAVNTGSPSPADLRQRNFYAHLYIGLFLEAQGKTADVNEHLKQAAEKFADDGYMGDVARAHLIHLKQASKNVPQNGMKGTKN